jgi:mannose-6-phosphate isomerase-like protein (cupin superfamily)
MPTRVDRESIKKDWAKRDYSCDLFVDPPGQCWEDFVHPVDELVMVMEGKLEIEMEGKAFCPEVGKEVFIPRQVFHSVRNIGDVTARWFYGYKNT